MAGITNVPYLEPYPYINHHDSLTQQENDNLMNHYRNNQLPETRDGEPVFVITTAIGVDTKDEKANQLRLEYNRLREEEEYGLSTEEVERLNIIREELVEMAQDSGNNAVFFTTIIEPVQPYGTDWRKFLQPRVKGMLSNNTSDPSSKVRARLREEQSHVKGIMTRADEKTLEFLLHKYGHKPSKEAVRGPPPPPAGARTPPPPPGKKAAGASPPQPHGGYKKSYGKKKKTKKTRRKTKNMRRKSKSKTKTTKKNTRRKKKKSRGKKRR
jgi:hypothetical protein